MPGTRMVVGFRQAPVQLDADSGRAAREEREAKSTLRSHASKQAVRLHHHIGANSTVSGRDTGRRCEREQTEVSGVAGTVPVVVTKGTGERDGEPPTSSPHAENFAGRPLKLETFIPSAGVVTADGWILDLGIRLAAILRFRSRKGNPLAHPPPRILRTPGMRQKTVSQKRE